MQILPKAKPLGPLAVTNLHAGDLRISFDPQGKLVFTNRKSERPNKLADLELAHWLASASRLRRYEVSVTLKTSGTVGEGDPKTLTKLGPTTDSGVCLAERGFTPLLKLYRLKPTLCELVNGFMTHIFSGLFLGTRLCSGTPYPQSDDRQL